MSVDDSYTKALFHFDAIPDGYQVFLDEAYHNFIVGGNAQIDTAQYKFYPSSMLTDGVGDGIYLTHADFVIGTGAFTVDCWARPNGIDNNYRGIIETRAEDNTAGVFLGTSSKILIAYINGTRIQGTTTLLDNTWYHVALVGNGGGAGSRTLKMYVDGIQEGSTYTYDYNFTTGLVVIGASYGFNLSWIGWIDEARISIGIQRWTSNFTRPVGPYVPTGNHQATRGRNRYCGNVDPRIP